MVQVMFMHIVGLPKKRTTNNDFRVVSPHNVCVKMCILPCCSTDVILSNSTKKFKFNIAHNTDVNSVPFSELFLLSSAIW